MVQVAMGAGQESKLKLLPWGHHNRLMKPNTEQILISTTHRLACGQRFWNWSGVSEDNSPNVLTVLLFQLRSPLVGCSSLGQYVQ